MYLLCRLDAEVRLVCWLGSWLFGALSSAQMVYLFFLIVYAYIYGCRCCNHTRWNIKKENIIENNTKLHCSLKGYLPNKKSLWDQKIKKKLFEELLRLKRLLGGAFFLGTAGIILLCNHQIEVFDRRNRKKVVRLVAPQQKIRKYLLIASDAVRLTKKKKKITLIADRYAVKCRLSCE